MRSLKWFLACLLRQRCSYPTRVPVRRPRCLLRLAQVWVATAGLVSFCKPGIMLLPSMAGQGSEDEIRLPLDPTPIRIAANTNSIETVREEVLNPNLSWAIAAAHSIPHVDVKGIEVSRSSDNAVVVVRRARAAAGVFDVVAEDLRWYIQGRAKGHSVAFLFGCLTNRAWQLPKPDGDVKTLADRHPKLPTALLRKWESGGYTNRVGTSAEIHYGTIYTNGRFQDYTNRSFRSKDEVESWTNYILVDGELAWIYQARHPPLDPAIENIGVGMADAKEFDPRFRELILRADKEARAELERQGQASPRQWRVDRLKKEKLKAQGIDWRSPADLSPGPRREWEDRTSSGLNSTRKQ